MITSGLSYDNLSSPSRTSPSGTGRLAMIIPWYYGLTTRKMVPITGRASASFSSILKLKRIRNE